MSAGYIALPAEKMDTAGAIVWWRLSGDTSSDKLEASFEKHSLPIEALPSLSTPTMALQRALLATFGRGHANNANMIRGLENGGRAVVREKREAGDLSYDVELKVGLDEKNQPTFDPEGHPDAYRVRSAYKYALTQLSTTDIGGWLVKIIDAHDGVRLRDTGGVYFIPAVHLASWHRYVAAIHDACSHRLNHVPAVRTVEAIASILDALAQESTTLCDEMLDFLNDDPETITKRKAKGKLDRCMKQMEKIESYKGILGAGTDTLTAKLQELADAFTARAMVEGGQ